MKGERGRDGGGGREGWRGREVRDGWRGRKRLYVCVVGKASIS